MPSAFLPVGCCLSWSTQNLLITSPSAVVGTTRGSALPDLRDACVRKDTTYVPLSALIPVSLVATGGFDLSGFLLLPKILARQSVSYFSSSMLPSDFTIDHAPVIMIP